MTTKTIGPFQKRLLRCKFDVADFRMAWALFVAAGNGRLPTRHPGADPFLIDNGDGSVDEIRFTDTPYNRGVEAVREHYGAGNIRIAAFLSRVLALNDIVRDVRLQRWRRTRAEENSDYTIFEGMIDAAATEPLTKELSFRVNHFVRTVEAIEASAKYPSPDEEP